MTIPATQVATRARYLLQDASGTRWTDAEILHWINEGRREMARIKPTVFGNGTEVTHTLTAGCRQRITTADAYRIDSINYNVASGAAIRATTKDLLDAFKPAWRKDTGTEVQNWFSDETDPLAFWVYPAAEGVMVKAHVHISPADLTALSDTALPFDIYEPALVNYVCAKALAKEDEAGSLAKAQAFAQLFTDGLS